MPEMEKRKPQDYIHPKLNETVKAIGGEYVFVKEAVLPFQGKKVLYLIGCAVFNSTCCGTGGVCYAHVPGFVHDLEYRINRDNRPVSRVSPIVDSRHQEEIHSAISRTEMVHQVEF